MTGGVKDGVVTTNQVVTISTKNETQWLNITSTAQARKLEKKEGDILNISRD